MKIIDNALKATDDYVAQFKKDPLKGYWVLEAGLPKGWIYDENESIKCEVLRETDIGILLKISPKQEGIVIDDLVDFVKIIISINHKIEEKENEFKEHMAKIKSDIEKQAEMFYEELDVLKESSFKSKNNKTSSKKTITKPAPKKTTAKKTTGRKKTTPKKSKTNVATNTTKETEFEIE